MILEAPKTAPDTSEVAPEQKTLASLKNWNRLLDIPENLSSPSIKLMTKVNHLIKKYITSKNIRSPWKNLINMKAKVSWEFRKLTKDMF